MGGGGGFFFENLGGGKGGKGGEGGGGYHHPEFSNLGSTCWWGGGKFFQGGGGRHPLNRPSYDNYENHANIFNVWNKIFVLITLFCCQIEITIISKLFRCLNACLCQLWCHKHIFENVYVSFFRTKYERLRLSKLFLYCFYSNWHKFKTSNIWFENVVRDVDYFYTIVNLRLLKILIKFRFVKINS